MPKSSANGRSCARSRRARGGVTIRRARDALRRHHPHDPPRPAGARGSGLPALRRPIARRRPDAVEHQRPGVQGTRGRPDPLGAVRACTSAARSSKSLSGTPFRDDVESAFEKLASALTPHMRQFLDQLPRVIATKPDAMHGRPVDEATDARKQQVIARALEATLHQRQATITYHSTSSERTKTVPRAPVSARLRAGRAVSARLRARVRRNPHVRRRADPGDARCSRSASRRSKSCPTTAFPDSLGVHSGPPEPVEIEFEAAVADYVRSADLASVADVRDAAGGRRGAGAGRLRRSRAPSWILSFGPSARVASPAALARDIARQLGDALCQYAQAGEAGLTDEAAGP